MSGWHRLAEAEWTADVFRRANQALADGDWVAFVRVRNELGEHIAARQGKGTQGDGASTTAPVLVSNDPNFPAKGGSGG